MEGLFLLSLWDDGTLGKILMTFLISMVPVLELRGAIPIALAHDLGLRTALIVSIAGNLLPVPFIILFIRRIFAWLRRKNARFQSLVERMETRAARKAHLVRKYAFWGLFVLVAIPLPGTGAWTGALVAAMLNMRMMRAIPAIFLGLVAAGVLVVIITCGAGALLL